MLRSLVGSEMCIRDSSCSDNPWTIGTINVTPANENVLLQIFQIASTLAASVATVVIILLADGTPIEVQVLIVLLNSVCASNVDRESVILVRYFISPAIHRGWDWVCLLYTSDAADEEDSVDLGGRRIIKKKKKK
eukprot:TRINITY_DN19479_c0_g1_i2.p1 TRINITY_DN19479_c0_g1~~TRINITY_DN19479_c0_g1_i2.p1  ORF type:complete len:135 (-),score=36.14 TRINITY_DN19479_c0_g1_i2:52-456(-)